MASSNVSAASKTNIPEYEIPDVNSKPFHIDSFRNEWLTRLTPSNYSYEEEDDETFQDNFMKEMNVSADIMAELKSACSIDALRCHPVDQPPDTEVVPPDPILKTLIHRKERQDYRSSLKITKNRHDLYADELDRVTVTDRAKADAMDTRVPEGEVILSINVYYPAVFDKFNYIRPHMTLLMLGCHTLAELRDAICCVSDLQVCGEFSNNPDAVPDFISKDHYKSAFFFFEGVFYNDMRFPECQDISMTTIEWAKSHNAPNYSHAQMEDTQLVDLNIKVGYPYLYCHQGDCEHLVIITDIRLTHKTDCLDKTLYPILTHKDRIMTQKCAVCHLYIGRWVTTNDSFAPSNPCIFCNKCFQMLHYDTKGNKLGDFQAYPYVDPGAFN